jgi:hypothetical protein
MKDVIIIIILLAPFIVVGFTMALMFNYLFAMSNTNKTYHAISKWCFHSWYSILLSEPIQPLNLNKLKIKRLLKINEK